MLRIAYRMRHRNMPKAEGRGSGPQGRINKLRKLVTQLVRHERIEGKWWYLDEARGYAELLIQEAQKHGDSHKATMELADYWLLEKDLIHKLFKELVPRFSTYSTGLTKMYTLPIQYPGSPIQMGILELKGNPWPPVIAKQRDLKNTLVNVLLQEAKKDYRTTEPAASSQEAKDKTKELQTSPSSDLQNSKPETVQYSDSASDRTSTQQAIDTSNLTQKIKDLNLHIGVSEHHKTETQGTPV